MPEFITNLFHNQPGLAALILIGILVLVIVFCLLIGAVKTGARKATQNTSNQNAFASPGAASAQDDDSTIKASGTVERVARVETADWVSIHLAIRLEAPVTGLSPHNMLRVAVDSAFVDAPLLAPGDRLSLEFQFDDDGNADVSDLTWLPAARAL